MKLKFFKNKKFREWIEVAVEAFLIIFIMYFVCWPYAIDGDSMLPGLHSGDRVVMSRLLMITNNFNKNDIVVCKIGINGQTKSVIKRVVGFPGDTVTISDGIVFINGIQIDEQYTGNQKTDGNVNVHLQDGEYYVLGDNRYSSTDSRSFGVVKRKELVGKIFFKFFPFNQIKSY